MSLHDAWDQQQARYIAGREERFGALLSVVEWLAASSGTQRPLVVDLGAGPAAIGRRLLHRFPTARYVGVDIDPVLLQLGREIADGVGPGRIEMVECDAADPGWLRARGGVLLDADHLGYSSAPTLTGLAEWIVARDEEAAVAAGAPSWEQWWERARNEPELEAHCKRRDGLFGAPDAGGDVDGGAEGAEAEERPSLIGFTDIARSAGFSEVDTIWQRLDDRVVMAVKAGALPR
ncbi:MAG: class I SAM-dependent methyltransferase [Actinomycetota bacterium]